MVTPETKEMILKIRKGEVDMNNQSLFFSILIKGLLLKLDDDISVRTQPVPHFILHTGDDQMYLMNKGQNAAIEPLEISNEEYIYNSIPRCIVNPGSVDLVPDQLTNPYVTTEVLFEYGDAVYPIAAECRRMPVKLTCDLKYYVDTFRDLLELTQQVITKLSFIRTFYITYLGQTIICSYKIPEALSGEHLTELDGTTTDNKNKTLSLSIEVETNLPIFSPATVVSSENIINMSRTKVDGSEYGDPKTIGHLWNAHRDDEGKLQKLEKLHDLKFYSKTQ